jgi:F-type H+-transporting ATPase subunit delta
MNDSKISVRYSKALFQLAKEQNSLDAVLEDVKLILKVSEMKEVAEFLHSPILNSTEKLKAVKSIFSDKVSKNALSFLKVVIENKRENYLAAIARNYITMYKTEQGIKTVVFTTAVEIDEELRQIINKLVSEVFQTKVELNEKLDQKLVGGYILRIDDNQIDDSISSKLKQYKRELINTSFEKKLK